MTKTVNEMKNDIITKFGFENENTIEFFKICEFRYAKKLICGTYKRMMSKDICNED